MHGKGVIGREKKLAFRTSMKLDKKNQSSGPPLAPPLHATDPNFTCSMAYGSGSMGGWDGGTNYADGPESRTKSVL